MGPGVSCLLKPYGFSKLSRMSHDDDDPKVAHNVEVPKSMKARVLAYAKDNTLSQAAATRLLLDQALTRAGYPKGHR